MSKVHHIVLAIIILHSGAVYAGEEFIGGLRNVTGTATVIHEGRVVDAGDGVRIYEGDVLRTGKDGSLGVIFNDNSRISLGPESELTISEYIFKPAENRFGFLSRIARGTMSYISGKIGELSPGSVSFETPDSTIGTRGTSVLIGVREGVPE